MSRSGQRGAAAVEFVLLVPVLLLLFGLVVGGARVWLVRAAVAQASASAARGASLARDAAEAARTGTQLAQAQAARDGLRCERLRVAVDAKALARPAGTAGQLTATVSCTVPLGDLLVPGWPGSVEITHTAAAIVDRYRGRA